MGLKILRPRVLPDSLGDFWLGEAFLGFRRGLGSSIVGQ